MASNTVTFDWRQLTHIRLSVVSKDRSSFRLKFRYEVWDQSDERLNAFMGLPAPDDDISCAELPNDHITYNGPIMVAGQKENDLPVNMLLYGTIREEPIWMQIGFRTIYRGNHVERVVLRTTFFTDMGRLRLQGSDCTDIEDLITYSSYVRSAFQTRSLRHKEIRVKRCAVLAYCFEQRVGGLINLLPDQKGIDPAEFVPSHAPIYIKFKSSPESNDLSFDRKRRSCTVDKRRSKRQGSWVSSITSTDISSSSSSSLSEDDSSSDEDEADVGQGQDYNSPENSAVDIIDLTQEDAEEVNEHIHEPYQPVESSIKRSRSTEKLELESSVHNSSMSIDDSNEDINIAALVAAKDREIHHLKRRLTKANLRLSMRSGELTPASTFSSTSSAREAMLEERVKEQEAEIAKLKMEIVNLKATFKAKVNKMLEPLYEDLNQTSDDDE